MKEEKQHKEKCRFYNSQLKSCENRHNRDYRSRKKNGHLRKLPKRCEKDFCPLDIYQGE
jgi:hypothetical protein